MKCILATKDDVVVKFVPGAQSLASLCIKVVSGGLKCQHFQG